MIVENATRGAMSPEGRTRAFLRDEAQGQTLGTQSLYFATLKAGDEWTAERVAEVETPYAGFGELRLVEGVLAFSPDGRSLGVMAVPISNFPELPVDGSRGWRFGLVPVGQSGALRGTSLGGSIRSRKLPASPGCQRRDNGYIDSNTWRSIRRTASPTSWR